MGRKAEVMRPEDERALERAEEKLRRVEERAARMVAEARAELAQVMSAAGPAAVARRDGVTRQAIHDYIRRYGTVSPDAPVPQPSRRGTR